MIRAGMDVARLNMSHGTHVEHARRIAQVRSAAQEMDQPVALLADLPGPKFRLGDIGDGERLLAEGTTLALTSAAGDPASLPVRNPELLSALREGQPVYLADGTVELRVTRTQPERALCEVLMGGSVRSGSGINVPEAELGGLVPTPEDHRHLAFALSSAVDWIGVSFVQAAADLRRVRAALPSRTSTPLLMAKIEKRRALAELDAIVDAADGIMVARGDLGVETDLAEIPLVQKRIIARANARGRAVVTATQMLESMIHHEHPTRAEVTDVANAIIDGTDGVMLSGETAVGRHPVAAVEILNRVLKATEAHHAGRLALERLGAIGPADADAVSFAACELASRLGASAIVARVGDFETAAALARLRPAAPLVMLAESEALRNRLVMLRGVAPLAGHGGDIFSAVPAVREWLVSRGLGRPGSEIVVLAASGAAVRAPDTLRVVGI
jgi:pyruvate kinase